ncbi:MAG: hypothetical protein AAF074_10365 [Pseudomonadota bacterium]
MSSQSDVGFGSGPGTSVLSGSAATTLLAALILAVFVVHFLFLAVVAEDAFISFRFAQNVAGGHGFLWNIGEAPVEGYTNFLWVVIAAGLIATGLDVALFSQVIGFLAALGTMGVVYIWGRRLLGLEPGPALIPLALLAVAGPFATWAGSGMETTLFGFFLTLGIFCFVSFWQARRPGWLLAAAGVFVLASMTRPEGVIVFIMLGTLGILLERGIRPFLAALGLYLVVFGAYFAWRYSYFGYPLPNTFYAKTGGGMAQVMRGVSHAKYFVAYYAAPLGLMLLPILWPMLRGAGAMPRIMELRLVAQRNAAWLVPLAVFSGYGAYIVAVGGDYMAMFRFFAPVLPLLYLVFGAAVARYWAAAPRWPRLAGLAATLVLIALQSTPLEARLLPQIPNNHGTWRGVGVERWHAQRLRVIGEYFQSLRTDYDQSLATDAIGVIAFVADMKIIGKHGLVDVHIAHKEFAPGELGSGLPGHERGDLDYILSKRPDFYMYNRAFTEEPLAEQPAPFPAEAAAIVAAEYAPESVYLEDALNGEAGYFTYLRRKDSAAGSPTGERAD